MEEDEGEKIKGSWLAGCLVNGCPRKLRTENNLAGKQTIDAAFFPLSFPQMNNCKRSPVAVRSSEPPVIH